MYTLEYVDGYCVCKDGVYVMDFVNPEDREFAEFVVSALNSSDKDNRALLLWREWFDDNGDPWEANGYGIWCKFCGNNEKNGHESSCVFPKARELLGVDGHG